MSGRKTSSRSGGTGDDRRARAARALRENLRRRKAQQRLREARAADAAPRPVDAGEADTPTGPQGAD